MTASVPIVRYYDHLRFVYEVESRMRELRRSTEGEGHRTATRTHKPRTTQNRDNRASRSRFPDRPPAIKTAVHAWTCHNSRSDLRLRRRKTTAMIFLKHP